MDDSIKLIIHKGSTIFDSIIITYYSVIKYEQKAKETKSIYQTNINMNNVNESNVVQVNRNSLNRKGFNAYIISAYITTLINSQTYRKAAFKKLLQYLAYKLLNKVDSKMILIKLRMPRKQFLDYKWNQRITQIAMERREVDHAMSWLSTLGGAFSALGEEFQYCAEIAGKISIKQFELALRLRDPFLVARCKLYIALSLIQQGQLKTPKQIVKHIYKFSINQNDIRLQNMCQGIWAKLKYCYKIQKERHKT
ncbi:uncharacterized protein F58A4.6 [Apis mellifera]|uniref:Uncharacterized protein F58A4.6 n=1 Tax=Apis mellifera TaxID=7460 RepID=A0A7M7LIE7_APIME|nr:uncharacterized protein F58A4.6 [Apis mellifera]|eukprot:XP_001121467.2 uncharacterized protein F58A4.6 [Apis mellifera]